MERHRVRKPAVGIRPCIDGRCDGVRESEEEQTMRLARAVEELIAGQVRYSDGAPVRVVMADGTIGGAAEAARCQDKFEREGVEITLSVSPVWCYSTEVMDQSPHSIKGVWGFNGTERPGAVFLAAVMAAHAQTGLPAFSIYGRDVQDVADSQIPPDVRARILRFVKAGIAAKSMRAKSYLQIGGICMGIAGSILEPDVLREYFGLRSESVDQCEILRRIEKGIFDAGEFARARAWRAQNCPVGWDRNPEAMRFTPEEHERQWDFVLKATLIVRDLMLGNPALAAMGFPEEALGHNAIAAGLQGQRQWTDFLPNFDFTESILNSQCDWNGLRESIVVATENDVLNAMTMLMEHLLTDTPGIFADVRTYWSPEAVKRVAGRPPRGRAAEGFIHLINSGAAAIEGCGAMRDGSGAPAIKPYYAMDESDAARCLQATDWCPANRASQRGGGFSCHYKGGTAGGMPVTMARLNLVRREGLVLQLAEGYSCALEEQTHRTLDMRSTPTWPTTWFAPRLTGKGAFESVYSVMANWGANHCAFCYGHVGADLITLASMLRIPVCMHNVAGEDVFRPAMWAQFGTDDLEGADFRACKSLGPLYG